MLSKTISYLLQFCLISLPFWLPAFHIHEDNSTLLTAVSLLFAILVGFFIATATSNYLRLQTLIADANAGLVSLYNLVRNIEPSKEPQIGDAIDNYMIAALDYELLDYTEKTKGELNEVMKIVHAVEPSGEKGFSLISEVHSRMDDFIRTDQEITMTAKQIVTPRHWLIIICLAAILAVSLLSFRDGNLITATLVAIMLVSIYQILILIHEIDSNFFLSKQLAFKDPQQVFEGINRGRYYPEYAIKNGDAKPELGPYRIGVYKNYPASMEKEIRLVK
ncbi:MAG: hypothetical protein AAB780_01810 [Patescibacteria group bacterium]